MVSLQDWKIGAIAGFIIGILALINHQISHNFFTICFGPLYFFANIIYIPIYFLTKDYKIIPLLLPLAGMAWGIIIWRGIWVYQHDRENRYWKTGLKVGFIYGLCCAFWYAGLENLNEIWGFSQSVFALFFIPLTCLLVITLLIFPQVGFGIYDSELILSLPIIYGALSGVIIGYLLDLNQKGNQQKKSPVSTTSMSLNIASQFQRSQSVIVQISILIILIAVIFCLTTFPVLNPSVFFAPKVGTDAGSMTILTPLSEEHPNAILYRAIDNENSSITIPEKNDHSRLTVSPEDAPQTAQVLLDDYGGIPPDAVYTYTEIQYWSQDSNTGKDGEKYPEIAFVNYCQTLDGKPVVGNAAFLIVEIGGDGELAALQKNWPAAIPDSYVELISSSEAVDKMARGDYIGNRPGCICNLELITIREGYYRSGEYLEPVWILTVRLSEGAIWDYYVFARPDKHAH